jgi:hypothetical protein
MAEFDLDSPAGRRILLAGEREMMNGMHKRAMANYSNTRMEAPSTGEIMEAIVRAAFAAAMDDTCPTCGGQPMMSAGLHGDHMMCPNPDCKDGKVPPALYTREMVERELAEPGTLTAVIVKRHRAEVAAEIVAAFKEAQRTWVDPGMSVEAKALASDNMAALSAAFVERWAAEQ